MDRWSDVAGARPFASVAGSIPAIDQVLATDAGFDSPTLSPATASPR